MGDQQAANAAKTSLQQVTVHKTVMDIWTEIGPEEMPDGYSDGRCVGGVQDF